MKKSIEIGITIILVIIAVIVMINLMTKTVDKKEIANCQEYVKMADEYPDYFITPTQKTACDYYQIDVSSVRVIEQQ